MDLILNYVVDINDVSLFYPIDFKKLMNNTVLQYKLNKNVKLIYIHIQLFNILKNYTNIVQLMVIKIIAYLFY